MGLAPRQTGRERPPGLDNRPPIDATGGATIRKPGRTLLLSPGRRILMEEEVITPPRGGGHPAPEPQGAPRGVRAVPKPFPDDFPEDSLRASVGGSVGLADWPRVLGAVDRPPGGVWIDFIRQALEDSQSIVAGSLVSPILFSCWVLDSGQSCGHLSSAGTVPLRNVPDVFGMIGRRDRATESRILQGRDAHSIRVLVPDCRGLDQNFHDVTVVDMGDLSESHVSIPELSELAHKWPPAVINHMRW